MLLSFRGSWWGIGAAWSATRGSTRFSCAKVVGAVMGSTLGVYSPQGREAVVDDVVGLSGLEDEDDVTCQLWIW